jgi:hypothetical protein
MNRALTEARKADRIKMADAVIALARSHHFTAGRRDPTLCGPREVVVELAMPRGLYLNVCFNGDGPDSMRDVHVLSWHVRDNKKTKLSPYFWANVNRYHFQKATQVAYGFDLLMTTLHPAFAAISSGLAFSTPEKV